MVVDTDEYKDVYLDIYSRNLVAKSPGCTAPVLAITQHSTEPIGEGFCKPFCGPLVPCTLVEMANTTDGIDCLRYKCSCSLKKCHGIAFNIPMSAITDPNKEAGICHLELQYDVSFSNDTQQANGEDHSTGTDGDILTTIATDIESVITTANADNGDGNGDTGVDNGNNGSNGNSGNGNGNNGNGNGNNGNGNGNNGNGNGNNGNGNGNNGNGQGNG